MIIMKLTKHIIRIAIILSCICGAVSCKAWLTVDSEDRILEEKLFGSTDGFYTALNGVYIDLVNENLYSGSLTAGMSDILAQYYDTEFDNHSYGSLALYQAEAKRLKADPIWTRAYFLILNLNKIIAHCDAKHGSVLDDTDYGIIKGECLGLRALLHFELFRIFGRSFTLAPAADAIPYVTVDDPQVSPVLKAGEVAEMLLSDLEESMSLLENTDPVRVSGKNETDNGGRNLYNYRNLRMNYFAVKALAARVNMYLGYEYRSEAGKLADEIIEEAGKFFPFSTREEVTGQAVVGSATESAEDRILSSDIIFAVYNVLRGQDMYETYFSNTLEARQLLAMSENGYRNLYPEESDLRTYQWERQKDVVGNDVMAFVKYEAIEVDGKNYPYMIPVLRMSEMYLISAECHSSVDPVNETLAYERLNALRNARQTSSVNTNIANYIEDEYAREFAGEGQLFWYYKRKNVSSIPALYNRTRPDVSVSQDNYNFELPQAEGGFRE